MSRKKTPTGKRYSPAKTKKRKVKTLDDLGVVAVGGTQPPPIIYDPIPPADPPPGPAPPDGNGDVGPAPIARFHKVTLFTSQAPVQWDNSSPFEFLNIPFVEAVTQDDTTLQQPDGYFPQEFERDDDHPSGKNRFHSVLFVTLFVGNQIFRYRHRANYRPPNEKAGVDRPFKVPFKPGVKTLSVTLPSGGSPVKYVWRRLNDNVDPTNFDRNVLFQVT
jgi:hypothetical protein